MVALGPLMVDEGAQKWFLLVKKLCFWQRYSGSSFGVSGSGNSLEKLVLGPTMV